MTTKKSLLVAALLFFMLNKSLANEKKINPWQATELSQLDMPPLDPDPAAPFFGGRMARTMALLASSNEDQRRKVKILFYGQSIVAQKFVHRVVEKDLRKRFPYADLTIENKAIGGYEAPRLMRTALTDIYQTYPDLVVFHDYGGEKNNEFERIVAGIRKHTTAEILMWTHHVGNYGSKTRDHKQDKGSLYRSYVAQKYNAEYVDLRNIWKAYCAKHGFKPQDLIADKVHLNPKGGLLQAAIVKRHFNFNTLFPHQNYKYIRTIEAREALEETHNCMTFKNQPWQATSSGLIGQNTKAPLTIKFKGNRIDVETFNLGKGTKPGTALVLLDGKPVSEHQNCFGVTRASPTPGIWFPGINRISLRAKPQIEDWTLTITTLSNKGKHFEYALKGSKTGNDGKGSHEKPFLSDSGVIHIRPSDFSFPFAYAVKKKSPATPFDIKFSVFLMGKDLFSPKANLDHGYYERHTLAQGMKNDWHTLTLIPNGDGPVPVARFIVHEPPLK